MDSEEWLVERRAAPGAPVVSVFSEFSVVNYFREMTLAQAAGQNGRIAHFISNFHHEALA